jgi:hypothetical protein
MQGVLEKAEVKEQRGRRGSAAGTREAAKNHELMRNRLEMFQIKKRGPHMPVLFLHTLL